MSEPTGNRSAGAVAADLLIRAGKAGNRALARRTGGEERAKVVLVLAAVLALSSADASTVGASATHLRSSLGISNTDIGLLVSVTSIVGAVASIPFGLLADRVRRTWLLGSAIILWGLAMIWSATVPDFGQLLLARVCLGGVTAVAGPVVASLTGDYFPSSDRGRIYGYILAGELIGAGVGFGVTGDIAALSWRAAFVILALPAFALAWFVFTLREPERGSTAEGTEGASPTDAQRLADDQGIEPEPELVLDRDPAHMGLIAATRYILRVRTNIVLIAASALGYYFLAGVQTFGIEFVTHQYRINQALANGLLLVVGGGAVVGVLAGGTIGDRLLKRGYLNGRVLVAAISASLCVVLFVPALLVRDASTALPYIVFAALALSAQNPPLDAARLDVMVPLLWGRAEGVRTFLRTMAQALAPLLFGAVSDYVFGGGRNGLKWTFVVMLVPLAGSAVFLVRGLRTYPRDVATAAASTARVGSGS
ncbi:MAG TPA: MFS transporter [Gaiellaceae bacterium]|nr:MFS transporter [Gaiellaceae bacterium]